MTPSRINIAKDFSKYPAGRFKDDGPASGQEFRESFLLPTMRDGNSLVIELDGTRGYGSSFLEEAFGGTVRAGYNPETVKKTFELISNDTSLIEEIHYYIDNSGIK